MPRRLTNFDHESIKREMNEPPKPQPEPIMVRLSCGHEVLRRLAADQTAWVQEHGACEACRTAQMLSKPDA